MFWHNNTFSKNIILFSAINSNESINVVSLAYRLEICFLFIQLERDNIHNFVRVIGITLKLIISLFIYINWACMMKQNKTFTFKIFIKFSILGVCCIMQISNHFYHRNTFTSSQLIDFQRFENNFYCLVFCFVKTSTIEVFIRCTSYKVKNGTNIF